MTIRVWKAEEFPGTDCLFCTYQLRSRVPLFSGRLLPPHPRQRFLGRSEAVEDGNAGLELCNLIGVATGGHALAGRLDATYPGLDAAPELIAPSSQPEGATDPLRYAQDLVSGASGFRRPQPGVPAGRDDRCGPSGGDDACDLLSGWDPVGQRGQHRSCRW